MIKFLLEDNLNKLAKWLRFLGYDSKLLKAVSKNKLASLAIKEKRIILTRANKFKTNLKNIELIKIDSEFYPEQLKELKPLIQFNKDKIFSRCSECNSKLHKINKTRIEEFIPKYIFHTQNEFKICRKCGKIYWQGSHYKKILKKIKQILVNDESSQN